jgi:hypothetical protein
MLNFLLVLVAKSCNVVRAKSYWGQDGAVPIWFYFGKV